MSRRATTLATRAWRLARMTAHLLHGLVTLTLAFPRATSAARDRHIRAWGQKLLRIMAVRHAVDVPPGFDPRARPRLLIGNHVSWLDVFALQAVSGARFVAKAELASWPLVGRLIRQSGTVFIERGKRSDTRRINATLRRHLEAGEVIAVFPEGTTSDGRDVLKFHANLLQAALDAGVEVVPFCLRYVGPDGRYSEAPAYVGDMTFLQSVGRILAMPRFTCEVTFFPPLSVEGRTRRELALAAQQMVRERLHGHSRQDR